MGNRSNHNLFGDTSMKHFIKDLWEAIKLAKEVKAKAIIAGAHWY